MTAQQIAAIWWHGKSFWDENAYTRKLLFLGFIVCRKVTTFQTTMSLVSSFSNQGDQLNVVDWFVL